MDIGDIAFPHLGIYLHNVPQHIMVWNFPITLYGAIIGLGILCGMLTAAAICQKVYQMDSELIWDFALYAVFCSVLGARIYYVIFAWDFYKDNLLSIFAIRQGGLAIYGGVIAAYLTLFIYCKVKKLSAARLGDICMPGLVLGQVIGRWGNFFNREVFGEYSDGLLAMRLPIAAVRQRDISESLMSHIGAGENFIQVHPTFLYESLWNLVLFFILLFMQRKKKFDGEICLLYLGGYGLGRFWIEGIRTDTLLIPGTSIPVSQALAAVMLIGSIVFEILIRIRKKKQEASREEV